MRPTALRTRRDERSEQTNNRRGDTKSHAHTNEGDPLLFLKKNKNKKRAEKSTENLEIALRNFQMKPVDVVINQ